jgi:hypothetical protein
VHSKKNLNMGRQKPQPTTTTLTSCPLLCLQAVLNVTNDASRVADLLDEFMSQYSSDPQLKSKFLQFMADQANTKYSVVDNKLNWVLWLYSLIWMPLLVLMCLTRMGKGSGAESDKQRQYAATGPPVNGQQQQQQQPRMTGSYSGADLSAGLYPTGSGQFGEHSDHSSSTAAAAANGLAPRRRVATSSGSLDLPPRYSVPGSFGRPYADDVDGSMRSAASGRSLRQAMNSGSIPRVVPRASSDRLHLSRPSKLHATSSLPPQALMSSKGGSGGGSFSRQRSMQGQAQGFNARMSVGAYPVDIRHGGDVRTAGAVDQAAMANSSSSSQAWLQKGQQQQQRQQQLQAQVDVHLMHDDAAAAAD